MCNYIDRDFFDQNTSVTCRDVTIPIPCWDIGIVTSLIMGYDPYTVVRERPTDPSSGTVPDTTGYDSYPAVRERFPDRFSGITPGTTIVSERRILSQEGSGNRWKRGPETVTRSRFRNT